MGSTASASMEYVDLCRASGDCRKFSRLVMGTDHLIQGGWTGDGQPEPREEEAFRVLDEAARSGINFFDTSPIYVGDIEHRLGKWRRSRVDAIRADSFYLDPRANPDRKLYVLSKGGFPFDLYWAKALEAGTHACELKQTRRGEGILAPDADRGTGERIPLTNVPPGTYASRLYGDSAQITARVAEELGHSRRNLDDDIAVYLMHRDDGDAVRFRAVARPQTPVRTLLHALSQPAVADHFWALGWSNWQTDRIDESLAIARSEPDFARPMINSPYFSLFEMSERSIHALGVQVTHAEMMSPEFQKGIRIMPYSPLGGFSILDQPEPKWENAKKAARAKFERGDPYWQNVFHSLFTPANEARWNRVVKFTDDWNRRHGSRHTVDQMLNAYVLAHPRTDFLAVGPITIEQVRRTVGSLALAKRLTAADLDFLYSGTPAR